LDGPENDRRERLHELDSILDALEQLNLSDTTRVPPTLRESLVSAGVEIPFRANITELIERVWELQEQYLQTGGTDASATLRGRA
jgi:hypothetical protein